MRVTRGNLVGVFISCLIGATVFAAHPPGEQPALGLERVTQDQIRLGELNHKQILEAGKALFTTSFNKLDGFGDGPMDPTDSLSPGGRPTLQGNGTLLRVNGLDAQSCLDCHAVVSAATSPPTLGIGGAGTANNNAIIKPTKIDPADLADLDGAAGFNGRFANPPFVFGAGGVELLGLEMTQDLQAIKQRALDNPGRVIPLVSKGVDFGTIAADLSGVLDLSQVSGVADDLIVRPFGRKGAFATVRGFDTEAMQFHFGMQPVEAVGQGVDADGDDVVDEILTGELSALSIFIATLERPSSDRRGNEAGVGFAEFQQAGCPTCHIPTLRTNVAELPLREPEDPIDPTANVYYRIDLTRPPARFRKNGRGGIEVPLFADLKRHDMGPALAESMAGVDSETNASFTTARLWGVADTAPYLHDGRATTLTEAIEAHGGEAQTARDRFDTLTDTQKAALLSFLRTLRTPGRP